MKHNKLLTTIMLAMGLMLCLGLTACGDSDDMQYGSLDLEDYITVGQYKGLEVEAQEVKVSQKEIQEKVDEKLKDNQQNEDLKEGDELENGDTANIDFSGKVDGEEFEGGTSKDFDLELGSGAFIPGFEDGLVGKKVGETVDLNLTFPDDYSAENVAGKDVVFTVKINSATRPQEAKYNDAWVKGNTEYKSKKEFEDALKKEIQTEKEDKVKTEQKASLWSDVLENTEVKKYPEKEMEDYQNVFSAQVDQMAKQYNMSRSEVLKQMYGTDDEAEVKNIIEDSVKTLVKQEMTTEYIADKEDITYTDEEKEKTIAEIEGQGVTEETVVTYTGRTMDQYAHIKLLYDKVQDFILDNAKVKEPKK